jgi:hypothetical protein
MITLPQNLISKIFTYHNTLPDDLTIQIKKNKIKMSSISLMYMKIKEIDKFILLNYCELDNTILHKFKHKYNWNNWDN